MKSIFKFVVTPILALVLILLLLVRFLNYYPERMEKQKVSCPADSPILPSDKKIKILNWNVQYMASKNYIFFYDLPDFKGKDIRPSIEHVNQTIGEVARVISDEKPDILLLQEFNEGSTQTYQEDQLAKLMAILPTEYKCYTDAFYFKSKFMPQYFYGPVGMKLVVLSKYKISEGIRFQLTQIPGDFISQSFGFKRAILQAELPTTSGKNFYVMSTHLDAFSAGTNTMEIQVKEVASLLQNLTNENKSWVISGDFNLLPVNWDKSKLHPDNQTYYNPKSEMEFLKNFKTTVNNEDLNGKNQNQFYTHFPNHPEAKAPDRTIDYYFYSDDLIQKAYFVRNKDSLKISDHLPMIFEFEFSKSKN